MRIGFVGDMLVTAILFFQRERSSIASRWLGEDKMILHSVGEGIWHIIGEKKDSEGG